MHLRTSDHVIAHRIMVDDAEIFDLFTQEKEYYRIIIVNYYLENRVVIKTNIDDFKEQPIFLYQSEDPVLDALFMQAKFVFESFIEYEYMSIGDDFDIEVTVIDVDEEVKHFINITEKMNSFIVANNLQETISNFEAIDENDPNFEEFAELVETFTSSLNVLDEIFYDKDIYTQLVEEEKLDPDKMN